MGRLVFTSQCRSKDKWFLVGGSLTCLQGQLKSMHVFTLYCRPCVIVDVHMKFSCRTNIQQNLL